MIEKVAYNPHSNHSSITMTLRSITTLLVLVFLSMPAAGQSLESLSAGQQALLKNQSLTVELPGLQLMTESGEEVSLGYSRHWIPYRGYERISERQFFQMTGNMELAQKVQRARKNKLLMLGLGGLSFIAGTALMISGSRKASQFNGSQMGPMMAGGLLVAVGGGTMGFTAARMQLQETPYWIARDVASAYNDQLVQEMGN